MNLLPRMSRVNAIWRLVMLDRPFIYFMRIQLIDFDPSYRKTVSSLLLCTQNLSAHISNEYPTNMSDAWNNFKSALLIPMVSTKAFNSTDLSLLFHVIELASHRNHRPDSKISLLLRNIFLPTELGLQLYLCSLII